MKLLTQALTFAMIRILKTDHPRHRTCYLKLSEIIRMWILSEAIHGFVQVNLV
jgi:hypothetical protein